MRQFTKLTSVAIPLDLANVDTDCIIPARFLRRPRAEFGLGLFFDLRFDADGAPRDFVLNQPEYAPAQILVADENFGCGSSREAAVWALAEHTGTPLVEGIHCIIAPSFGDIFFNNCCNNGVLPVILPASTCAELRAELRDRVGAIVTVDLLARTVELPSGRSVSFAIDDNRRQSLIDGVDDIAITEALLHRIDEHEAHRRRSRPWLVSSEDLTS